MNLKEGLRVLHVYTAGSFNFYTLSGAAKKTARKHVMEALLEQKTPIAKCGINTMRQAFHEALSVQPNCIAREDDEFVAKARDVLRNELRAQAVGLDASKALVAQEQAEAAEWAAVLDVPSRKATHAFVGSGAKCEYDWPGGDEPSDACGRPREEH